MKTPAQRAQERRAAKLEQIERDIKRGSLVVRQMTPAERAQTSPRPRKRRG